MSAPIIYRYDDPGAPDVYAQPEGFYNLLRACLVDGYGSKPAAGWSVVYEDYANTGIATFTNAAQSGVLGVVADGTRPPYLFLAEAMVDINTPVSARSGRKIINSYADFVYGSSEFTQRPFQRTLSGRYWCVIANENTALLFFDFYPELFQADAHRSFSGDESAMLIGAMNQYNGLGNVAAPAQGNFHLLGGMYTRGLASSSYRRYCYWGGNNERGTVLYDASGAIGSGGEYSFYSPLHEGQQTYDSKIGMYGSLADQGRIPLIPVKVGVGPSTSEGSSVAVAEAPMLYASLFGDSWRVWDALAAAFNARALIDPVTIDGKQYLLAKVPPNLPVFISLALEDWQ